MTNPHDKPPPRWPLDLAGDIRDRNRVKTPPTGVTRAITEGAHLEMQAGVVTVRVEDIDDITGRYTGVELAKMRAERAPEDRLGRVEDKHDELELVVHAIDKRLARQDGQLEELVRFGEASDAERARRHAADMARIAERAERRRWLLLLVKALGAAVAAVIVALATAGYFK